MAEYRHLATPHPHWGNYPNNLPPNTRILKLTRDRLPITPQPGLEIEEFNVPARDGYPIRVRSYRQSPVSSTSALPLLIWFHGGGFVTGGLETDDVSCRAIAAAFPLVVLNVEYRLAPEHPFPVGFEDSLDVVRWAASPNTQPTLHTDLSKGFILGGTSAGANFTAGIAHLLVQDTATDPETNSNELSHPTPVVTGILFLAGTICHEDARPPAYQDRLLSIDEITESAGLTKEVIRFLAEKYEAPPSDARRSPLLFESHAGLTLRAAVYACGWDPRRDETLLLEELLRGEGVQTKKFVYSGLPHGFWMTCPDLDESKQWEKDFLEGVSFLLEG
ncbi:Alpha/Beta hydrolase protein [Aspergillus cavernicola]|uniref:Alpha/Beta hydrolase protein n=1 Tax=Aspergillus cavernicola TaxID=176166 RepID=A0ABR4J0A7_9EURO